MKKNGFIFAETIIVIAVLSVGLIMLYSLFSRIYIAENRRAKYDNTEELYHVYHVKEFLETHKLDNCFYKFEAGQMYSKVKTKVDSGDTNEVECDLFPNSTPEANFYYQLLSALNIEDIYITNYDVTYLKENETLFRFDATLMNYITTLSTNESVVELQEIDAYRIIVKFNNEKFASLKVGGENEFVAETEINDEPINSTDSIIVDIVDNMIPVSWNGSTLIKADKTNKSNNWYDYDDQKWANAVLVTNSSRGNYKNATPGTNIKENDILAYYTYIPRYRYLLWNADNNNNCLNNNCNEQEIRVEFETKTTTKSSGSTNGYWLTHPAFTFGNSELNGIWVGKFSTSADPTSTCYTSPEADNCDLKSITPRIKPNLDMWRYVRAATMFSVTKQIETNSMYGLTSYNNTDSHMMKNMEWGAVAYLSHSEYGKYGNKNYTGTNKQLYVNNYRKESDAFKTITGCSSGTINTSINQSSCLHRYPEQSLQAMGASTTGNIYGVFDMSGGVNEYVMGQIVQEGKPLGTFHSSSLSGTWDSIPELKYYDSYEYDINESTHARGYLGDATKETLKTLFPVTSYEAWYNDKSIFPSMTNEWFLRGGVHASVYTTSEAGAFTFARNTGSRHRAFGFRVVLVIE